MKEKMMLDVRSPIITADPRRFHGEPVISRKRFPVSQVIDEWWPGCLLTVEQYGQEHDLTRDQVLAALWHAGTYGIWKMNRKGRLARKTAPQWLAEWAYRHVGEMWREDDWSAIPDPTDGGGYA